MIRSTLIAVVVLALAALPVRAAEPIDRADLVAYVEDGVATGEFAAEISDLRWAVGNAWNWLLQANYAGGDTGEAVMHARQVVAQTEAEMPALRTRLAAFPEDLVSFPPVLLWDPDWMRYQAALLDQIEMQADYLARAVTTVDRRDFDATVEIDRAMRLDTDAYESYLQGLNRAFAEADPTEHPDRLFVAVIVTWEDRFAATIVRGEAASSEEWQELTLPVLEAYAEAIPATEAIADQIEAALPGYREALLPYTDVLAGDAAAGAALADTVIESYTRDVGRLRTLIEIERAYAALEAEIWRDGPSPEILERFTPIDYRAKRIAEEMAAEWVDRARLMRDAARRTGAAQ